MKPIPITLCAAVLFCWSVLGFAQGGRGGAQRGFGGGPGGFEGERSRPPSADASAQTETRSRRPFGAGPYDTSAFMAGEIYEIGRAHV